MNAAQQNIRFLGRRKALAAGEEWVDPFVAHEQHVDLPAVSREPSSAVGDWWRGLGDGARPRNFAFASALPIPVFLLVWLVMMFFWGMGSDTYGAAVAPPPDGGRSSARENVLIAAGAAVFSLLIAAGSLAAARYRSDPSDRVELRSREGALSLGAAALVLGGTAILVLVFWKTTPLRSVFAPYTH